MDEILRRRLIQEPVMSEEMIDEQSVLLRNGDNQTVSMQKSTTQKKKKIVLYHWDDIPEWQRDNEHIHNGYVKETMSLRACFESLGYLHNETVNIYSHLIPGVLFFTLLTFSILYIFPIKIYDSSNWIDYVVIGLFFAGASACLTLSSIFHCFKAHSLPISILGNKLDYLGIVILIVTSMVGIIFYSFIDRFWTGIAFNSMVLGFGVICGIVSMKDEFRKPSLRGLRAAMFVIFGLSGVLPVFYGIYLFGLKEAWERSGLGFVLLELFFYIAGATLYGSRFPERLAPGRFDYFGNSHQIFHFFVVIAACCHFTALLQSYNYAHQQIIPLISSLSI